MGEYLIGSLDRMENKEIYPQSYLEIVRMRGQSLLEISSNDNGLFRPDALEALKAIQGARLAVLGVAVLKIVNGAPRYNYDGCHCDQEKGELMAEYFRRSSEKAMGYVSAYPYPDDGTILYALTLAGEDWLRDHSKFNPPHQRWISRCILSACLVGNLFDSPPVFKPSLDLILSLP